jgi:hypothetical protein
LFFTTELFTGKLPVSYHPAGGKDFLAGELPRSRATVVWDDNDFSMDFD